VSYRVKPSANRKYVKSLLAQLPPGFRIGMVEEVGDGNRPPRLVNSGHPCVLTPDGELLRNERGQPVAVCGTPSNRYALKRDLRMIQHALEVKR
jgi:hypothetical protein